MNSMPRTVFPGLLAIVLLCSNSLPAMGQECFSGTEMDGGTYRALEAAANRFYQMSAAGDVAGLKANSAPEVAANFSSIEKAVVSNKAALASAQPLEPRLFLLDATNSKTNWQKADFYCGIYNSPDRVGISIPNLPPGRYAMAILKATGKEPITLTLILQESSRGQWQLAGYYARPNTLGGHDGQWFMTKAREYKDKGQLYNAWFYYLAAWDLLAPVDFISTPLLDKLGDDTQAARPPDLPSPSQPLLLTGGAKTFKVVELTAVPVNGELWVRAEYESANAANPPVALTENAALLKTLLEKYPQFREAFGGVVARASDGAGHDYVTLTLMKDAK